MIVLLPPSETKRPGGSGAPLDLDVLSLPSLRPHRVDVVDALVALSADEDAAARVLKLSARRRHEIADNAALWTAPTLPAIDRYTGVLFDAIDASSLDPGARAWMQRHVLIHSAPFGPVGALDAIPAYRLSAGTSIPGLAALRRIWADAVTRAIRESDPGFVLDLRSEAYVGLGPLPAEVDVVYVRVVAEGSDGVARALNHCNKKAKGELARALSRSDADLRSVEDLREWAGGHGFEFRTLSAGEVALVV